MISSFVCPFTEYHQERSPFANFKRRERTVFVDRTWLALYEVVRSVLASYRGSGLPEELTRWQPTEDAFGHLIRLSVELLTRAMDKRRVAFIIHWECTE